MSQITVAQARSRGVTLPADDDVAQDIIDEQEAWLVRRIGQLVGERTETFYVGLGEARGKLGLARYTDGVAITDGVLSGAATLAATQYRLVDNGSAVVRAYASSSRWWAGPYVRITYTPNDELLVESALYDLVALAAQPATGYDSEQMGAYSYHKGTGVASQTGQRAAIAGALVPRHQQAVTLRGGRTLVPGDPVINRAELLDTL